MLESNKHIYLLIAIRPNDSESLKLYVHLYFFIAEILIITFTYS